MLSIRMQPSVSQLYLGVGFSERYRWNYLNILNKFSKVG